MFRTSYEYIYPLKESFYQKMDSENTRQMKKYMKDHFDFFGIKSPNRKEITKNFIKQYGLYGISEVPETLKYLWQLPQREYSKTAPEFVLKFVERHKLSTLSKNEALKVINRK